MNTVAIVPAAGKGLRANLGKNKLLAVLDGKTVLERTLCALSSSPLISHIIVVVQQNDFDAVQELCTRIPTPSSLVLGGQTRTQSVANALSLVGDADIILVHDGARPYVTKEVIARCVNGAKENGSAIAAVSPVDTIAVTEGGVITQTPNRDALVCVQTPQAFRAKELQRAYQQVQPTDVFTDDASVYAKYIRAPYVVEGDRTNVKLTHQNDFAIGGAYYCGTGFDVHPLVENRPLVLGGVNVPHDKGLLGHSDADALTHAVMDALLSAAALGDIGKHFPDTDPTYKGADSIELLKHVVAMLREKGVAIWNVSATLMAQRPKLAPFIPQMQDVLSRACEIPACRVGIGATTTEGLGIVGQGQGIAVHATALIVKEN